MYEAEVDVHAPESRYHAARQAGAYDELLSRLVSLSPQLCPAPYPASPEAP